MRAYLDGHVAEAMSLREDDHVHQALRRISIPAGAELGERWRRNMVLNKWLEYLMDQGHLIQER